MILPYTFLKKNVTAATEKRCTEKGEAMRAKMMMMWVNGCDSVRRQAAGSESGPGGKESSFHHWGDRGVKFFLVFPINSLNKYSGKQKN